VKHRPAFLAPIARRAGATLLAVLSSAALLATSAAAAPAPSAGRARAAGVEWVDSLGGIDQYQLRSNGMKILLVPNHAAPVITFMVVYHVGSRNEAPGNTGSAHLLEHMLFNKSTENFGRAKGHKTFQEVLFEAGADGSTTNMTTWYDRMNGYSTLPADKLDLAMRIEADRLGRGLILDSERKPEMSVVRNEYEIGENNPGQALYKAVVAEAIVAHPYHWSTIGYRSDIEGVTTETLRQHYRDFFHPDNADAILVGDFEPASALALFAREFGALPRSTRPVPKVITVEPRQEGERRVTVKRPGEVGQVEIAYMRPGALDPDFIPLDLLSEILGDGVNSRLYQALVETGLATDASASNYTLMDPFPFLVDATVTPGVAHAKVEAAMKAALHEVGEKGVTAEELARAKKQLEVSVIRSRDGTYLYATNLGDAVASANWKWFVTYVDQMKKVTADDVKRVAATYLVPDHATVGWFMPVTAEAKVPGAGGAPSARGANGAALPDKRPGAGGSTPGSAAPGSFASRTFHRVLANGLTLDVVENHAVPTVALQGLVLAGRMAAPAGKPAVPQLAAVMLTRGTTAHDKREIAARLDNAGAQLGVQADVMGSNLSGAGLSRDLRLMLGTLAEEITQPAFADSELVKAKREMSADVLRASENTFQRAYDRLTQLAYPESHPYRAPTKEEMLASIDHATPADLRAFHRDRYVGAGTTLVVVGDVDAPAVAALVDSLLGGLTRGERPALPDARTEAGPPSREVVTLPGKANVDIVYGEASGLRRADPDYEAALIANAALGQNDLSSRLGVRVRDTEGLSYAVFSRFAMTDLLDGVFLADAKVAPQNVAKAVRSAREVMELYAREGITQKELDVQKNFFAGNFQVRLATNAGVASALLLAERYGFGPSYLDVYPARIRAVTREQVNSAIRAHLKPDRLHLVVAGALDRLPD
jgi:zinc protease